jgi:hypothetical protein
MFAGAGEKVNADNLAAEDGLLRAARGSGTGATILHGFARRQFDQVLTTVTESSKLPGKKIRLRNFASIFLPGILLLSSVGRSPPEPIPDHLGR